MTTAPDAASTARHAWQRWEVAWHGVFAATLTVGLVASIGQVDGRGDWAIIINSLGLAAAYLRWNVVRPARTPGGQALAHAGLWLLWLGLIWQSTAFVTVGVFLAAHVCYLSVRWAVPVAAGFVGGIVLRQVVIDGAVSLGLVVTLAVGAGIGVVLAAYIAAIARESAARADLLDELHAARAQVDEAERQQGVLLERQRLARDLHDTIAQGFTSVIVQLRAAEVAEGAQASTEHHARAMAAAKDGLGQVRQVVWNLDGDVPTLEDGLGALGVDLDNAVPLAVRHVVTGEAVAVSTTVRREVLLIAREALTNVARHAQATTATVTLSYLGDALVLDVCDDGRGSEHAQNETGYGIRGMRDRAERLGGQLNIESTAGAGTTVVATVPLR